MNYESLGGKIKELRISMDLTQAQVAEALNVTPGYISNVENNRTAMSLRILIYYAKLMNITLDSLVGRVEPEYENTALDNELIGLIKHMSDENKLKLINTIKIWNLAGSTEKSMLVTPAEISDDFIGFMLDERARETYGEMNRWEDLVRTETLYERVKEFNPDAAPNIKEYHKLRPIPQNHIDRLSPKPSAEEAQNEGYY